MKYSAMIVLDAIDPMSVESAFITVRADNGAQAQAVMELFLKPDVKIIVQEDES